MSEVSTSQRATVREIGSGWTLAPASVDCGLSSAQQSNLNEFCPRKEAWALVGGALYPLAKLRNF